MPAPSQPPVSTPKKYRPSRIIRLRQGLALALILVAVAVMYFWWSGRGNDRDRGKKVAPVGLTVRQTAHGFSLSRSEGGRPVFRLYADQAIQLKQNGRASLKNVRIDLYDQDATRADQIYGQAFAYDPATGTVAANGIVHIDLGGIPGQTAAATDNGAAPQEESGHPVHIETNDLVFNIHSGIGDVQQGLNFAYLGAQGKADRAHVTTHPDVLTLTGHVQLNWSRSDGPPVEVTSDSARLDKRAALVELDGNASVVTGTQTLHADRLQFLLRPDYSVREAIAIGHVTGAQRDPDREVTAQANQIDATFVQARGTRRTGNPGKAMQLATLQLHGAAELNETAPRQHNSLTAGAMTFLFDPSGALQKLEARENARLMLQNGGAPHTAPSSSTVPLSHGVILAGTAGTRSIAAPGLDFLFNTGKSGKDVSIARLQSVGRAHLRTSDSGSWMTADANQFNLDFDAGQHPRQSQAAGDVFLQQQPAPVAGRAQPLRSSHSDRLQLVFSPGQNRLEEAIQQGHVQLQEADRRVRADTLHYRALTDVAELTAQPGSSFTHGQVFGEDAALRFRAPQARLEQGAGRVQAEGGVQVSFLSPGGQAAAVSAASPVSGPMFTSRMPVDVTADRMNMLEKTGQGDFDGHVRLWQGQNLILADTMHFDRTRGKIEAAGHVASAFVQPASSSAASGPSFLANFPGKKPPTTSQVKHTPTPISITADRLTYSDASREGQYLGNVVLTSAQARLTARELKIILSGTGTSHTGSTPATLQSVTALGGVKITQPGREAKASTVRYDLAENVITMKGGPPSIYDAEHGYLTGETLTFSPSGDTIRVESQPGTRTFGEYRVKH